MEKSMLQQTDYKYGFSDDIKPKIEFDKGLSPMVIRQISDLKDEPRWMLDYRLESYKVFLDKSNLTPSFLSRETDATLSTESKNNFKSTSNFFLFSFGIT